MMNNQPASFRLTVCQLNELIEIVMHQIGTDNPIEAVELINSGKYFLTRDDGDDVLYFSVTSDGTTGPQWIERLESKGYQLTPDAKDVLRSPDFNPTTGITTKIAILKSAFFALRMRNMSNVRAQAEQRKWMKLNAEAACLMRELLTTEKVRGMGLASITFMHDPIEVPGRNSRLLCMDSCPVSSLLAARIFGSVEALSCDEGVAYAA